MTELEVLADGPPESSLEASSERRLLRGVTRQPSSLIALAFLVLLVLMAIFASAIAPYAQNEGDLLASNQGPSVAHWFGTDRLGKDTFSRVVFGSRVALWAAIEAAGIAVLIGVPLGLIIGYVGGRVDQWAMRGVDAITSIPGLVIALALISTLGPGLTKAMLAVGIVFAMVMIRLTRAEALAAREELYVDAARANGASSIRIMAHHLLPNLMPPLIVQVTLLFALAILLEASLSFLGLGVGSGQASWGLMLSQAQNELRENPFLAFPPGIAIFLTVLAFNTVGDAFRDVYSRAARGGVLGVSEIERAAETVDSMYGPEHKFAPVSIDQRGPSRESDGDVESPSSLLTVRDLHVSFPGPDLEIDVVSGIDLDIDNGEILALVGESGCGKTVTAMSIVGLVPDPGRVKAAALNLAGTELTNLGFDEFRKIRGNQIGVVFQEPMASLNPAYTVVDQVGEGIRHHQGLSKKAARARVEELFTMVGIANPADRLDNYPHQFSGGMAQRVMIAMAISCSPKLLIADEPTTALDVTVQSQVLDVLTDLRNTFGMSVLLITHDLGVVADVADRAAIMYAGEIVEQGTVDELFANPQHPYTEGLLASVPRNIRRRGPLASIPGRVPQPAEWPIGCRFADRCDYVEAACRAAPIELTGDSHEVRCRRSDEISLRGVRP